VPPCGCCAASIDIRHDLLDVWVDTVQLPLFMLCFILPYLLLTVNKFRLHFNYLVKPGTCTVSLVPRLPRQAFVACSTKSGRKAWTDLSRDAYCC